MTTPGSQAGTRPARSATGDTLRAVASFIDSSRPDGGLRVACGPRGVRIRGEQPYGDPRARQAVLTRLAGLIGGTLRQESERAFPAAYLWAAGAAGRPRLVVSTDLPVRRDGPPEEPGRPFAQAPCGQVTVLPGRLPDGWRWVTALDPKPDRAAPRKHSKAGTTQSVTEAPALAACDCPPLTSAALQAAARQGQPVTRQPAQAGARPTGSRHSRSSS